MLSSQYKAYSVEEFLRKAFILHTYKSCSYLGTKGTDVKIYDRGVQQPGTHDEDFKMIWKKDRWYSEYRENISIVIQADESV